MKKCFLTVLCLLLVAFSPAMAEVTVPTNTPALYQSLQHGDKNDEVLKLQTRLKELCYYRGPLSGQFAEVTKKAVQQVQADYGLEQTGVADAATQEIIYGECYRTLRYGMSGDDVTRMQEMLKTHLLYQDEVSGNFLKNTRAAVQSFQGMNGLEATGIADAETLKLLYSGTVPIPTPTPTPEPTPTPTPTPTPDLSYQGKLEYGSTGARVKLMQERLLELGFFEGKVTTGFYARSSAAVKAFQKHNALKVDGIVGEDTWTALFSDKAIPASATPAPPTPVPYFIEVDVKNQVTKVYTPDENGEYTQLHKTFICSTGTVGYPSDVGTWTLSGRRALWATFPTWGGGTAQYWTKINESIAFHSVMYRDYDPMQLVKSSYNNLGTRASHGCIRLTVADAKWIYDNCREGVQVWIHEDAKSDPELTYSVKPGGINPDNMRNYVTPTPSPAPVYDSYNPPEKKRQMVIGSKGEDVYWVQMRLKELGYYTGTVTGEYRGGTQNAIKKYQRDKGLQADGIAGTNTLSYLYNDAKNQPTPTPPPTPTPTATPVPTPTATYPMNVEED